MQVKLDLFSLMQTILNLYYIIIGFLDRTCSANKIRVSKRCFPDCEGQRNCHQQLSRCAVCQAPGGAPETGSAPACREMARSERCNQTATNVRCHTTSHTHFNSNVFRDFQCLMQRGFFRCLQDRETNVFDLQFLFMDVEIPEVSEDCLYLNIYTPVKPGEEDAKLPVSSTTAFWD